MESKSDEDEAWLYDQLEKLGRRPTDSQVEHFCERVAIMVANGKAEDQARKAAFRGATLFSLTGGR